LTGVADLVNDPLWERWYMQEIKPPIIVVDDTDIMMFESIKEAEQGIEPVDAKAGDFVAYDAEGRVLRFDATHWRVTIKAPEDVPSGRSDLEIALRAYLKALAEPLSEDEKCDLPCLVNACRRFR